MKTAADILKDKQSNLVSIPHDRTIKEAVSLMVEKKIGAVLVSRKSQIVGIWSERDFMRNSLETGFQPDRAVIGDYMTTPVRSASHNSPLVKLLEMFLGLYIRHILIEKGGGPIGILSIGDVTRASLLEKDRHIKELNSIASWEYYEDWGWDRKYRSKRPNKP